MKETSVPGTGYFVNHSKKRVDRVHYKRCWFQTVVLINEERLPRRYVYESEQDANAALQKHLDDLVKQKQLRAKRKIDKEIERETRRQKRLNEIGSLSPREIQVMDFIYKDGLTMREAGLHLSVTQERIRQIRDKSLRKIKLKASDAKQNPSLLFERMAVAKENYDAMIKERERLDIESANELRRMGLPYVDFNGVILHS